MRTNLLNFKYHGRTGLRRPLAALLLDTYQRHWHNEHFDVIIPLPLSAQRAAYRGYNQSQLLSEIVAAELNIAHRPQLLYRTKDTRPLAKLTREERRKELKGAFAAEKLDGQRILLIDDIYTSGASSTTATEVLLKAGAQSVHVLTCAAGYDL